MLPTLPDPPPPRELPSAHRAPASSISAWPSWIAISGFLFAVLGILVQATRGLDLSTVNWVLEAAQHERDGTERNMIHTAMLPDGRIYATEVVYPGHRPEFRHWTFDPASHAAAFVRVPPSFRACVPVGLDGATVVGIHPDTVPPRACHIQADTGSSTWTEGPLPRNLPRFAEPISTRRTDVDLEELVRPWHADRTLFGAQPLRTHGGEVVSVEGRPLVVGYAARKAKIKAGSRRISDLAEQVSGPVFEEHYFLALPNPDSSAPVWVLEGAIRGHTTFPFDGVFLLDPDHLLLVVGALVRTVDVRTGEVVRSSVLPLAPP